MESWEMKKKAEKSLSEKMAKYYGDKSSGLPDREPMSYEEAKERGNWKAQVSASLSSKLGVHTARGKELVALSNEVHKSKSIGEIQSGITALEAELHTCEEAVKHLVEAQENKLRKEYSTIGGLAGIHLERAVNDDMNGWLRADPEYLQAVEELREVKKNYTAHCNAKDMYIEEHADLIEAEKEKVRKEEFLASGILEEMGITPAEDDPAEE